MMRNNKLMDMMFYGSIVAMFGAVLLMMMGGIIGVIGLFSFFGSALAVDCAHSAAKESRRREYELFLKEQHARDYSYVHGK